jgi:two-component system CheB/CheR fusion protein
VPDEPSDEDFGELLVFLRESRGVDFTGYKRTSLRRLVGRRMRAVGVDDVREYLDQLEVEPHEVRGAVRQPAHQRHGLLPRPACLGGAAHAAPPGAARRHAARRDPVRAWSAACASGEEAYSLAILLHELLGDDDFRRRVKIYATDVDDEALATARAGRYPPAALELLGPQRLATYFVEQDGGYLFRPELRQNIIFGRHDLLADAPISRVSLLLCRNVLMYFTAETQARIWSGSPSRCRTAACSCSAARRCC